MYNLNIYFLTEIKLLEEKRNEMGKHERENGRYECSIREEEETLSLVNVHSPKVKCRQRDIERRVNKKNRIDLLKYYPNIF